jgi:hypothetical protein
MLGNSGAASERWAAALLCVATTWLILEPTAIAASRSLNNPNQTCLDAGSSDVQRDCSVRTAQPTH